MKSRSEIAREVAEEFFAGWKATEPTDEDFAIAEEEKLRDATYEYELSRHPEGDYA